MRILPGIAATIVLAAVGTAEGQVHLKGNIESQVTKTSETELKRWFVDPSKVGDVPRSGNEVSVHKASSYKPQGVPETPMPPNPPGVAVGSVQAPVPVPVPVPGPLAKPSVATPLVGQPQVPFTPRHTVQQQPVMPAPQATTTSPNNIPGTLGPVGSACGVAGCGVGYQGLASTCATGNCGPVCNQSCLPRSLCDRPCNNWTFATGAIFMNRRGPDAQRIFTDPNGQSIDAANFSFDLQTGVEAIATKHRAFGEWDAEIRYFGIEDWSTFQSRRFDGNPIQINHSIPTFISGNRRAISNYSSDLHNFEWNLKRPFGSGMNFLVGFRHIQINEQLTTRFRSLASPPIATTDHDVRTRNRLYGLQLGFSRNLIGGCNFCLESYGKAGLFANDTTQRSSLTNFIAPEPVEFAHRDRATELSFAREIGLRLKYNLCSNVNFYTGYRGLWIDGVALASDQIPSNNFAGLGSNIDNSGDIFYHGGTFGLEILF